MHRTIQHVYPRLSARDGMTMYPFFPSPAERGGQLELCLPGGDVSVRQGSTAGSSRKVDDARLGWENRKGTPGRDPMGGWKSWQKGENNFKARAQGNQQYFLSIFGTEPWWSWQCFGQQFNRWYIFWGLVVNEYSFEAPDCNPKLY